MASIHIPKTSIYLRDRFQLQPGSEAAFCSSARELVNFAPSDWQLIAGASFATPYNIEKPPNPTVTPPRMMHIWRLRAWDTLYNSMYETSELGWYMSLEACIQRESQDFLVDYRAGHGVTSRPKWQPDGTPGYLYRYETIHLGKKANQYSFLVSLVSFAAEVKARGWSWVWSASSVTGEQRVLSLIWCAPTVGHFERALASRPVGVLRSNLLKDALKHNNSYLFPIASETYLRTHNG